MNLPLPPALAEHSFVIEAFIAGLLASLACGLGALPLAISGLHLERRIGLGYAFAAGLMFSASVYNLLLPAFTLGGDAALQFGPVAKTLGGMALGALFLWAVERYLTPERLEARFLRTFGSKTEALIFLAMAFHSVPEGVAVGVGFGSERHLAERGALRALHRDRDRDSQHSRRPGRRAAHALARGVDLSLLRVRIPHQPSAADRRGAREPLGVALRALDAAASRLRRRVP